MAKRKIRERADEWIAANPKGVALFERFALELQARQRRFGINLLRERVRWETTYQSGEDFKFPNEFSPYVARHLIEKHPTLSDHMVCKPTKDERARCRAAETTPPTENTTPEPMSLAA